MSTDVGIDAASMNASEMVISTMENNQYNISLFTEYMGAMAIAIYDAEGRIVAFNNLQKSGKSYDYHLDMSYAAPGVYLIKMGDQSTGVFKTERIVVVE